MKQTKNTYKCLEKRKCKEFFYASSTTKLIISKRCKKSYSLLHDDRWDSNKDINECYNL